MSVGSSTLRKLASLNLSSEQMAGVLELFAEQEEAEEALKASQRDRSRPSIPVSVARAVWERDGRVCAYCGDTQGPFHLDHIFPWSRGGTHSVENLTVSCAPCNLFKSDLTLEELGWQHG